jgi:hypothetical protein
VSEVRRIPGMAVVDVPHGAWCVERGDGWAPGPIGETGGVSAGPHSTRGYTPAGEALAIQTDGGVILADGAESLSGRWVDLYRGRVVS